MNKCFVCAEPASSRYTVVLEGSTTFEQKTVCDVCVTSIQQEEWIDVHTESVLANDGGSSQASECE